MHSYQELFSESFARTMLDEVHCKALLEAFVARFFIRLERIESLFRGLNTVERGKILHGSILQMSAFASTGFRTHKGLQELAERHRTMAITRQEYDFWLECLIQAVAESDPFFESEIGDAWRISMAPGIAYMLLHAPVTV
jgi:hemoglobin-like flavoprotein